MESRLQQLRDTANEESALAAANRKISDVQTLRSERKQEYERKKAGMIEAVTEVGLVVCDELKIFQYSYFLSTNSNY